MITIKAILETIDYIRGKDNNQHQCWCNRGIIDCIKEYRYLTDENFLPAYSHVYLNDILFKIDGKMPDGILEVHIINNNYKYIEILTEEERNIKDIIQ